jgi:hypothetical protein
LGVVCCGVLWCAVVCCGVMFSLCFILKKPTDRTVPNATSPHHSSPQPQPQPQPHTRYDIYHDSFWFVFCLCVSASAILLVCVPHVYCRVGLNRNLYMPGTCVVGLIIDY